MRELQTAKRKGYTTSLKWLVLNDQKLTHVIKDDGNEVSVNSMDEIVSFYDPVADPSLFSGHIKNDKGSKPMREGKSKKKQPTEKPTEKHPSKPKGQVKEPETNSDDSVDPVVVAQSTESFSDTIETTFVLQMISPNGVCDYEMEFESIDDFNYRLIKLREKYPKNSFAKKIVRAMVSYVKL